MGERKGEGAERNYVTLSVIKSNIGSVSFFYTVMQIDVVPCGCQNGGTCVTDVNYPAGSGKYLCVCPEGKRGKLCYEEVDECLSAPCTLGKCTNTASGYRCECPAGLRG